MEIAFGDFISRKRTEKKITLMNMSRMLSISPSYLADIEHGRRNPMDREKIPKLADILELSDKEREEMFDLAGKTRNEAPADLSSYLVENPHVRYALRKAKSMGAGEDEWLQMVADLEKRTREKALRAKEESAKRQ